MMIEILLLMFMLISMFYLNKKVILKFFVFWLSGLMIVVMSKFNYSMVMSNLMLSYGSDSISFSLVLLSIWIIMLMMLVEGELNKMMFLMFLLLLMVLIFFFYSLNLFILYFWFECSLIPVMLIIVLGGNYKERLYALMYFFIYTLFFSMPLIVFLFYMYMEFSSLEVCNSYVDSFNLYIFIILNLGFLIKLPLFIIHIWLFKAHVEAPVYGSMILAAILLKMGGFGIYRLLLMFYCMYMKYNIYIIMIGLIGAILISLICLIQVDLKTLIAYSSIVHMVFMISGMMTNVMLGIVGGFIMMVGHGLCSSGLFGLVGIIYDRSLSRSIYLNKGLLNYFPYLSILWFFLCIFNMSAPLSINLMSEILLINSLMYWSPSVIGFLILMCFFSAAYSMYLFSISQHGLINYFFGFSLSVNCKEYFFVLMHILPLMVWNLNFMVVI